MKIQGEISLKNDDFTYVPLISTSSESQGVSCSGVPWRPNSTEDREAVERHADFQIGIFSDPLYKTGDWPKRMLDTLPPDYLPRFTEQEKKDNLGV